MNLLLNKNWVNVDLERRINQRNLNLQKWILFLKYQSIWSFQNQNHMKIRNDTWRESLKYRFRKSKWYRVVMSLMVLRAKEKLQEEILKVKQKVMEKKEDDIDAHFKELEDCG